MVSLQDEGDVGGEHEVIAGGCGNDANEMDFTNLEDGYTTAPIDQYSTAAKLLEATLHEQQQQQHMPAGGAGMDMGEELVQTAFGEVTSLLDSSMAYLQNM